MTSHRTGFEEHRFWDIRRWKIAQQVYGSPLHGMSIIRNGGDLSYAVTEVFNRYSMLRKCTCILYHTMRYEKRQYAPESGVVSFIPDMKSTD
ncbi:RagB/SusD family nutrient uptake outer membrane protein [Chitinophaga pinensis]|uniref:RagB/SusD family nutrient uptake outer membrane protein n=1 Tax=Chitinophaga pinensis TaxID=79329 RepID=UPI0021BD8735|nr:RagB/SusD family nutrient uptake outer membrane protein [Chitinophaga pinensis]